MFILSCKYMPHSPVRKSVDSILKHHPNEKIVIVDSQSDNHDYHEFFSEYDTVEVLYNINKYRTPGAFYEACKRYPDEPYYVNIHDSVMIKKPLHKFIDSDEEFVAFGYFPDTLHKVCGGVETRHEYQYMKKVFANTKYFLPNLSTNFNSCFGPLYIIKNSMMKRLMDSGMLEKIKSTSKIEDQMYERIMGILAEQEGYNLVDHNIEGNLYANNNQKWDCMVSDKLEYFTKRLLKRD